MSSRGEEVGRSEGATSRFGGVAREGGDMLRRAFSVAAREEANQVRQEAVERLAPAAQSSGMMLAGGALAALGGVYLLQALVGALSTRMPRWLASLLVGGGLTAGGLFLLERGRRQLKDPDPVTHEDQPEH